MSQIPEIEKQTAGDIKTLQMKRIHETLKYTLAHSEFYRRHFEGHHGLSTTLSEDDFARLPVTSKDDLQKFNWDFLCVPRSNIAEYTSTSGTLGKPVTIALTQNDLERLAYNELISFQCADGSAKDVYQLAVTLDRQFMAGLAYYEGVRKLGAGLIRVGPGLPALQWETIEQLKPTTIVIVPSFLLKLINYALENGIDFRHSSVKKAICIGESIRNQNLALNVLGKSISEAWDIHLYGTYASTEMQTAFTECGFGRGGHHHPELVYVEILNEKNQRVDYGVAGEVTITTLGIEGMPLVRYKTGDVAVLFNDHCSCGRNTDRMGPIAGRKQQMIKLKGTTLYPQGVFEILNRSKLLQNYIVEASTGEFGTDELTIYLATAEENRGPAETEITAAFQSQLRVVPVIKFMTSSEIEHKQLSGNSRKANRFLDHRNAGFQG